MVPGRNPSIRPSALAIRSKAQAIPSECLRFRATERHPRHIRSKRMGLWYAQTARRGAINANDFSPKVREQHRPQGRRTDAGKLNDANACQRAFRFFRRFRSVDEINPYFRLDRVNWRAFDKLDRRDRLAMQAYERFQRCRPQPAVQGPGPLYKKLRPGHSSTIIPEQIQ